MKNTLLFTFIATLFCVNAYSQNLVVNPSFEVTSSNCANFGGEGFFTDLAGSWDNANSNAGGDSCSSPDLFSACNSLSLPFFNLDIGVTNMPNSALGFQYSRTGTRHAGFITYGPGLALGCTAVGNDPYREYIQGRTTAPLTAGQIYCVSMYVSLANDVAWATNNIGVYFSNTHYLRDACVAGSPINFTPQLNYGCSAITDTTNWVRLQWDYTATGGEQYFIIGNFFSNANTTIGCNNSSAGSQNPYAYYFIDDVSIVSNTCCFADILQHPANVCIDDPAITLSARTGVGSSCSSAIAGTWSGSGVNASTGVFNPSVAGAGTHTITFTLNCGGTATTSIVVDACTMTVCLESNGTLTAHNGTSPLVWQAGGDQDCSACAPAFPPFPACSLPPGCATGGWVDFGGTGSTTTTTPSVYPVRVTDAHNNIITINSSGSLAGCSNCALTLATTNTAATCGNATGSATVSVTAGTGPYTYLWSPGGATTSTINNVAGGSYSVTVTSQSGACTQTTAVTVPESGGITLSNTSTQATCGNANGSATVSITAGTGPYTYLWSPGGATTATASNLAAGNYTVTVSGANSCSSTSTVTVSSTNAITLSTTNTSTSCGLANGTVSTSITAGTGPYTYVWSPGGATTASVANLEDDTYTVTVTGAGGCTATGTATVASSTALTVTPATTTASCNQANGSASVIAAGGSGTFTYSWSNGATTSSITNVATGNYDVTVTAGAGCSSTQTIYVPQNTSLTGSATGTHVSCGSTNDGSVDLSISGGTGPYTYAWTPGNATTQDLTGVAAGAYNVTVTDNSGCQFLTSYTVISDNTTQVASVVQDETCKGLHNGTISLTVTGGTGPYTYAWTPGNMTTEDLTGLEGGAYTVTITDQGTGCSSSQSFTIQQGYNYPVAITQSADTLTATTSPNYQWYHNGILIPGAISQSYVVTQGGYFYCVTNQQNCNFTSNTIETNCICTNGIYENSLFGDILVYPNPATDELNVMVILKNIGTAEAQLHDVAGRLVWKEENKIKSDKFAWKIPVSDYAKGMYFVQVTTENETHNVRIIVGK